MFAARGGFASNTVQTDPYWANVKMLISANSGTIVDYALGATITQNYTAPGASLVTSPILYSAYSIYNTGGARWSLASNAARQCTGEFTFEWFWRSASTTAATPYEVAWMIDPINAAIGNIIGQIGTTNSNRWSINSYSGSNYNFTTSSAYDQTWHHIAFTRDSSNVIRFFYDGILYGTTVTTSISNSFQNLMIFGGSGGGDNFSNGYWDQLRLTVGVCRYTSTFTPPTGLFPTS